MQSLSCPGLCTCFTSAGHYSNDIVCIYIKPWAPHAAEFGRAQTETKNKNRRAWKQIWERNAKDPSSLSQIPFQHSLKWNLTLLLCWLLSHIGDINKHPRPNSTLTAPIIGKMYHALWGIHSTEAISLEDDRTECIGCKGCHNVQTPIHFSLQFHGHFKIRFVSSPSSFLANSWLSLTDFTLSERQTDDLCCECIFLLNSYENWH